MAVKTVSLCLVICLKASCSVNLHLQKEYKDEIVSEYAESCMTAGVAMKMAALEIRRLQRILRMLMDCAGVRINRNSCSQTLVYTALASFHENQ